MKFTLSWLKDHLQTDASLDEIAAKLTIIGLEVESIHEPARNLEAFIVARVLSAEAHPNADKLKVCQVETGKGVVQVVCGALNARAGIIGVFAPPGAYVPGSKITLGKASIRGVESSGMLCSERELELSYEHSGIIELPESAAARVGERFADAMGLNDPVIEIAITPNRPDCLGVRGIARDLAAAGIGKLRKESATPATEGDFDCPVAVELDFPEGERDACPHFAGRVITGMVNGPSPAWLQKRLRAIGLRPINAAVDVTNYIAYDRARPLHVYDAAKLRGPICARLGTDGESFTGLDGKSHAVDGTMCVIADASGVLGLGGIMGGEATGVTEATTEIFIESAYFDPHRTAVTGRKTGIHSDARYRFERGIDPQSVLPGLDLATRMILDACGGIPSRARVAGKAQRGKPPIAFDPVRVQRTAGAKYTNQDVTSALKKLGFAVDPQGGQLSVTAPSWRPDIHGPADLVEEIVRLSGVERIQAVPLPKPAPLTLPHPSAGQRRLQAVRNGLANRGMIEAITWSFVSPAAALAFGGGSEALRVANPISIEMSDMRPSLLPGLLLAVRQNLNRGFHDIAFFEVGQIFRGQKPEEQTRSAGGIRTGKARLTGAARHWDDTPRQVDVYDAKADALSVLEALGINAEKVQVASHAPAWYRPGRSGSFQLGPKTVLGYFGELHPGTLRAFDVAGSVAVFEIFLDAIPARKQKGTARGPLLLGDLQPVTRDFAFLADKDVQAVLAVKAAESADKQLITSVTVFDVFEGEGIPAGKKSLGLEITITPADATLTDAEIDAVAAKVTEQVKKATGAELRG